MVDGEVTVGDQTEGAPNTADVDTETITSDDGTKTLHRQRIRIGGEELDHLAEVVDTPPKSGAYGLVVRDVNGPQIRRLLEEQFLNRLEDEEMALEEM